MKKTLCSLLIVLIGISMCACGAKVETPTWQEQYDLGVRYLSEGNYEEAIIAFTAAIEIDPKQEAPYIGLADTYIAQGDTDKAAEILQKAIEAVGETEKLSSALIIVQDALMAEDQISTPHTEREDQSDGSYRIYEYGSDGELVCITHYEADGSVLEVSEYDSDGNRIRETRYYGKGSFFEDVDFVIDEYDSKGFTVRQTWSYLDGTSEVREYGIFGNEKETYYNADGSIDYYQVYEYDTNGDKKRTTWYKADGSVDFYWVFEYDANGNDIGWTVYNADGTVNHSNVG